LFLCERVETEFVIAATEMTMNIATNLGIKLESIGVEDLGRAPFRDPPWVSNSQVLFDVTSVFERRSIIVDKF